MKTNLGDERSFGSREESLPDIVSRVRFEGQAPNTPRVKAAIIIPADISIPIYGDLVAEVKCFSIEKPGFHYRGLFSLRGLTQRQAGVKAGVVAGTMAEQLIEVYKDRISTVEFANEGREAFHDAVRRFEAKQAAPVPRDRTLDYILEALRALQ